MPKKGRTQFREAAVRATRHLDRAMGFHVKRVDVSGKRAMYRRLFFGPPKAKLAQRSGRRIKPIAFPCELNTFTPSRSSDLPFSWNSLRLPTSVGSDCKAPLLPHPHQRLPSRSLWNPSKEPSSMASINLVLAPTVPSALTS